MGNYEEKICEAINTIVSQAIAEAKYDKTIQASIVSCVDKELGKYKVKYQDSYFYAYASGPSVEYSQGMNVMILIPGNDMSRDKTILRASSKLNQVANPNYGGGSINIDDLGISSPEKDDRYNYIGANVAYSENSFFMSSYAPYSQGKSGYFQNLYTYGQSNNKLIIDEQSFKEYLNNASHVVCGCKFTTSFDATQKIKGNYGIVFALKFIDEIGQDVIRTYIVDVDNMTGDPYELLTGKRQYGVFEIGEGERFVNVESVNIFTMDFPQRDAQLSLEKLDIEVSDIELWGADLLTESELSGFAVNIKTPRGSFFTNSDTTVESLLLSAEVKIRGKVVNPTDKNVSFFWFKEDLKIDVDSPSYYKPGGRGWECLNDFSEPNEEGVVTRLPYASDYEVLRQTISAKETRFKCVAIYEDVAYSKIITIKYLDINYDITITSDLGTNFYYDVGKPTLTCLVNGGYSDIYTYQWTKIDMEGNEIKLPSAIGGLQVAEGVSNNKLIRVNVSDIVNITTYRCAVYLGSVCIGIGNISLTNKHENIGRNTLVLHDNIQVFKYNEYGKSPYTVLDNKLPIPSLSFTIYDENGIEIEDRLYSLLDVTWRVPVIENSMFSSYSSNSSNRIDDKLIIKNSLTLGFNIKNTFEEDKVINNTIELIVRLKDEVMTASTKIFFLKEGDSGTNGTDVFCKIIPNGDLKPDEYPLVIIPAGINNPTAIFNKNNAILTQTSATNTLFSCYLYENGERVPEGAYTRTWSLLENKYTSTLKDDSFFQIADPASGRLLLKYNNYSADTYYPSCANILQCMIEYEGKQYYDTVPIPVAIVKNYNNQFNIGISKTTGFSHVVYTKDGLKPSYRGKQELRIDCNNINSFAFDINGNQYDYENNQLISSDALKIAESSGNTVKVKASSSYDGVSVNNFVQAIGESSGYKVLLIFPIHLMLNRYGLPELNGWNGNTIQINDGGYILAPEVGAGEKNPTTNRFTGLLMGKINDPVDKEQVGLIGLVDGVRSIFLDAKTGKASFGTIGGGQIIIDPERSVIKTGNYNTTNKTGMQIDLKDPSIKYGNGNFIVDSNGRLTAKNVSIIGGSISISDSSDTTKSFSVSNNGAVNINGGSISITGTEGKSFSVSSDGVLTASSVDITGGTISIGRYFSVDANSSTPIKIGSSTSGITVSSDGKISFGSDVKFSWTNNIEDKPTIPADLSSSVNTLTNNLDKIAGGLGGWDNITSTEITSTTIQSPKIYGGTISVRSGGDSGSGAELKGQYLRFYNSGGTQVGHIEYYSETTPNENNASGGIKIKSDTNSSAIKLEANGGIALAGTDIWFYTKDFNGKSLKSIADGIAVFG